MTTAYTSLLGLALPITGELSGTWGDTVNNSITSLLDSAVAGTTTITADTTLSTTTGAANQARQAILLCSPASANITITAPAQSKIYTVINTSGTYTVKICGVGPTTGVTLAVSESAVVAWNGTDFIRISSNTATTGNFTVNGNLSVTGNTTLGDASADTVTVNGTTTFNASPIISVTDNTNAALRITQLGTGNALLVEDTTNPDSTPFVINSAGNTVVGSLTTQEITGLSTPLLQVQGTTTGAAGLSVHASDTTNSGGWQSAKSRGTLAAPTIVNSGDNLGILRFAGYDGAGYIRSAEINGQVDGTPGTNDMPGRLVFSTTADGASTPTERMRIDSVGNVGIATASTAGYRLLLGGVSAPSPSGNAYGVANSVSIQSDVTATYRSFRSSTNTQATAFTLSNLYHFDAGSVTIGAGSSLTNQVGFYAQALTSATNNYGFYGALASAANTYNLYMAGTADNYLAGNVGIGTTTPITKLEIAGNNNITWSVTASITGTTMDVTAVATSGIAVGDLVFGANIQAYTRVTALGTGTGGIGTYTVSVSQTAASGSVTGGATYGNTLIRITDTDTTQNIGQPTGGLQFFTSDGSSPTAGVGAYVAAVAEDTSPDTALVFGTRDDNGGGIDANERMRITSAGNVGIGTSLPAVKLDVNGITGWGGATTGQTAQIVGASSGIGGGGNFRVLSNTTQAADVGGVLTLGGYYTSTTNSIDFGAILGAKENSTGGNTAGYLAFGTRVNAGNMTERMRIDSSGNLLVGTTSNNGVITSFTGSASGRAGFFMVNAASSLGSDAVGISKFDNNTTTSQVFVKFFINNNAAASGLITASGANQAAFTSSSDSRLKENIVDLSSQLANIMALRPVEFDYIESEGGGHQIGFIAQEVQEIYPDVVGTREDGMLLVSDFNKNDARLIKAIQEQQALITALTTRITALESI